MDETAEKKESLDKAINKLQLMIERLRVTEASFADGKEVDSILVAGDWLKLSRTTSVFTFYGEKMADVTLADLDLLRTTIDYAHEYTGIYAELETKQRQKTLRDCIEALRTRTEELARTNSKQTGQSLKYSLEQSTKAISAMEEMADQIQAERSFYENSKLNISIHETAGPCIAFPGWEESIMTTCNLLALSILTATPLVLVPHQKAIMTTLRLVRIFSEAGMPKGAAHVLTGDRKEFITEAAGNKKAASVYAEDWSGEGLAEQAAKGMKKMYFRQNRKDMFIVSTEMPIATIADKIVRHAINRTSPVIVFAEQEDYDALSKLVVDKMKEYAKGDPLMKGTDYWSLDELTLATYRSEAASEPFFGGIQTGKHYIPGIYLSGDFDPALVTKMKNQAILMFRSTNLNYSVHYARHIKVANIMVHTKHIDKSFMAIKELNAEQICINDTPGPHYEEIYRLFTNRKKIIFGEMA
jgi:Aldehyde dehydrogenase family